ncbi:conserved hypothetical protein [Burkholderia vietnamiensis]|nr:conserved hypothetical protein [Burkholderia vietnamiensis]SOT46148.1 hypothetical protein F01_570134 [Burkholderia cenocepacia]
MDGTLERPRRELIEVDRPAVRAFGEAVDVIAGEAPDERHPVGRRVAGCRGRQRGVRHGRLGDGRRPVLTVRTP